MFSLSPRNEKFFDMFIEFSELVVETSNLLVNFANDFTDVEERFKIIKNYEHEGDMIVHKIFQQVNDSFITPIDREDIYLIVKAIDDILDFIEITASRFVMFNIPKVNQNVVDMCDLMVKACLEINKLMNEFKNMKKSKKLLEAIIEINRIEDEGDILFRKAVRELFDGNTSAVEIIIWKEIYEELENVLDACEDVANIVEGIVMKHA